MRRRASLRVASLCSLLLLGCAPPAAASIARGSAPGVRAVPVPAAGRAVDTSHPSHVVGSGTAASCTSAAVVAAVRAGGIIRFSCGPDPVTIVMSQTAKVMNTSPEVVLDGRGLVTLSGDGRHRILYMDTCDRAQVWTTSHCQDQSSPRLVIQNLAFTDGNSSGQDFDGGGGGAIFDRGGRLSIVSTQPSPPTAVSPKDRTSAAERSARYRSTTTSRCTSSTADSPPTRAATAARSAASASPGRC
jgi:hypothetical protein